MSKQNQARRLLDEVQQIYARAEDEGRDTTLAETRRAERLLDQVDELGLNRRAAPNAIRSAARSRTGGGEWSSVGEFGIAVRNASKEDATSRDLDPRLLNAPTTYGTEGIGPDGGFAIPSDFRSNIMQKVLGEESLLARTDQIPSPSLSIEVPTDEYAPWDTNGGIQAYWTGEAKQYTQRKPKLDTTKCKKHKLTALVPVSDELLEDAPALASWLESKTGQVITYKCNDAIVNGTGAGMPLGIRNSPCKIAVAAEGSQAADTVQAKNIANMWSRMPASWRSDAVWLVHSDVEPQLMQLGFQVTDAAGANPVGAVPLYIPPNGLSGLPYGTLLGKPVIVSNACQALGDEGDIIFASLSQYMSATQTIGLRTDISIHMFFDYGLTAFRFTFRMGGQSWWSKTIPAAHGSTTYSPFITLAAR